MERIISKYLQFPLAWLFAIIISTGASSLSCDQIKNNSQPDNYVVMLSLDAFRWDYSRLYNTPNLDKMAVNGVKADALISCYPSKTFPNHYSIATGLYPDHHGIVNNSFFDPQLGYYSLRDRKAVENSGFYQGEPIWVTAEKQGVKTASFYWVGSEAKIKGYLPSYWKKYRQNVLFSDRIDTVIYWLSLPPESRPHLITWYYHEPDWTSHDFGPLSTQTKNVVENIDSLLGIFISKIQKLPQASQINIIIVSDHGMADVFSDKVIDLSKYLDKNEIKVISGGNPVYSIQPKTKYDNKVLAILKTIPHLKIWERDSIPPRYHYGKNPRVSNILVEADKDYSILWDVEVEKNFKGAHGYDPLYPEMQGIFYASGPAFKKGYRQPAFLNIDIYPLIAHILQLKPEVVDGKLEEVEKMLMNY